MRNTLCEFLKLSRCSSNECILHSPSHYSRKQDELANRFTCHELKNKTKVSSPAFVSYYNIEMIKNISLLSTHLSKCSHPLRLLQSAVAIYNIFPARSIRYHCNWISNLGFNKFHVFSAVFRKFFIFPDTTYIFFPTRKGL